eukprot:TRINITY_DN6490_c0_g1_i1.p1 TRINITY_DN6490_c0_g1~~TRINITY_DN6490_c0_g1_i1.p1  ORF type:complete len:447 (+),score=49.94 TRINITY_DN6490_c0_g1_i1:132-1472(+)
MWWHTTHAVKNTEGFACQRPVNNGDGELAQLKNPLSAELSKSTATAVAAVASERQPQRERLPSTRFSELQKASAEGRLTPVGGIPPLFSRTTHSSRGRPQVITPPARGASQDEFSTDSISCVTEVPCVADVGIGRTINAAASTDTSGSPEFGKARFSAAPVSVTRSGSRGGGGDGRCTSRAVSSKASSHPMSVNSFLSDGMLSDCVSQTWKVSRLSKSSADHLTCFKDACVRKYANLTRAWRLLLDPGGVGRVSFIPFCDRAKSIGFSTGKEIFSALDEERQGFITLERWDPVSFRNLMELRDVCTAQFGNLAVALQFGMDKSGSGTVNLQNMTRFCDEMEMCADPRLLLRALDVKNHGFLTSGDLDFLHRYEGDRFTPRTPGCAGNFNYTLARRRIAQARRRYTKEMSEREAQRVIDDKSAREAVHAKCLDRSKCLFYDGIPAPN